MKKWSNEPPLPGDLLAFGAPPAVTGHRPDSSWKCMNEANARELAYTHQKQGAAAERDLDREFIWFNLGRFSILQLPSTFSLLNMVLSVHQRGSVRRF